VSPPLGWLVLVLRATAVLFILALAGAALPESWMKAVYELGGREPWPDGPLLVYLARLVCILYGVYGLIALYLSFDPRRYLPLIRFLALLGFPLAPVMFVVIWTAGLPLVWAVSEPVGILVISALWYVASRPTEHSKAAESLNAFENRAAEKQKP
jgi:hypothetical protein